jgi:hypothetical protein
MAGKRREPVSAREITGLKYFDKLAPLLEWLHDDGCARDKAGNRELHYDHALRWAALNHGSWAYCRRSRFVPSLTPFTPKALRSR